MATQLKLRRGTTAEHASFTGAEGEITLDTTKDTIVVHDNYTAGGRPLLREDLNNLANNSIAISKISHGSATAGQGLMVNSAATGLEFGGTPNSFYGDFVGVSLWSNGPHNGTGTIDWNDNPAQGAPDATARAHAGFVRGQSSSTFAWDGSTFTVYDPGVYFVYASIIPHSSTGNANMYIRVNGSGTTDNRSGGSKDHGNVHSQQLLNLQANDYITITTSTSMHAGLYGNMMIYKMANNF